MLSTCSSHKFSSDASRVRRTSRPSCPACNSPLSAFSRRAPVRCATTTAASARPAQPRTLRLAPRRGAAGKADTLDLSARIFTYDAEKGPQRLAEMKRLVAQVRQVAVLRRVARHGGSLRVRRSMRSRPPIPRSRCVNLGWFALSHVRAQHQHGPDCNHDHDHGHGHDHVRLQCQCEQRRA